MKLWGKGQPIDKKIDAFTVGNDRHYDLILAPFDCQASIVHAKMLHKIDILTDTETNQLVKTLDEIRQKALNNELTIEDEFEDIHSKLEDLLTKIHGDLGKKIHTARSRNDQVLVAFQLYIKNQIDRQIESIVKFVELLLDLAKKNENILMPGYTHMQVAMPSSFGLWFSGYAETLIDDIISLIASRQIADQNPLGSAAGYGTGFGIDRQFTTDLLGFDQIRINPIAVQMGREKICNSILNGIAGVGSTISKFCFDICLYSGQEHNFILLDDKITTGSSIMPHKKNPDIFEIIRGKCNLLKGLPNQLNLLCSNLPTGYHRDLQLSKGIVIDGFEELSSCIDMTIYALEGIKINDDIIKDEKYAHLFSVNTLEKWVKNGMPFREAYKKMGHQIRNKTFVPDKILEHSHIGSLGNLSLDIIRQKLNQVLGSDDSV